MVLNRGIAIPIALVFILFLVLLVGGAFMLSRSQYRHTHMVADRLLASYIAEAGHNLATERVITEGWRVLSGTQIEGKLGEGKYYVYVENVPNPADGTLKYLDIYSKGVCGKTAQLYYQQLSIIPAPLLNPPAGTVENIQDIKILNHIKLSPSDIGKPILEADLTSKTERKRIKQAASKKLNDRIARQKEATKVQKKFEDNISVPVDGDVVELASRLKDHVRSSLTSATAAASLPPATEEEKMEYLADKGREIIYRDRPVMQVGNGGPLIGNPDEVSAILFGRAENTLGLLRGNMRSLYPSREDYFEDASTATMYYYALFQKDEGAVEGAKPYVAKAKVKVPIYLNYPNHLGVVAQVGLKDWVECLAKSVDIEVDLDIDSGSVSATVTPASGSGGSASVISSDGSRSTDTGGGSLACAGGFNCSQGAGLFQVSGNSEYQFVASKRVGYDIGGTPMINGNLGEYGSQRESLPPWAESQTAYEATVHDTVAYVPEEAVVEVRTGGQGSSCDNNIATADLDGDGIADSGSNASGYNSQTQGLGGTDYGNGISEEPGDFGAEAKADTELKRIIDGIFETVLGGTGTVVGVTMGVVTINPVTGWYLSKNLNNVMSRWGRALDNTKYGRSMNLNLRKWAESTHNTISTGWNALRGAFGFGD